MKKNYMIIFDEGKDSDTVYRRLSEGENVLEALEIFQGRTVWKGVRILEVYMINKKDFEIITSTEASYDDDKSVEKITKETHRVANETYKYDYDKE